MAKSFKKFRDEWSDDWSDDGYFVEDKKADLENRRQKRREKDKKRISTFDEKDEVETRRR
jgi:hypothetical protein